MTQFHIKGIKKRRKNSINNKIQQRYIQLCQNFSKFSIQHKFKVQYENQITEFKITTTATADAIEK